MRIKDIAANIGVTLLLYAVSLVFLGLLFIGIPIGLIREWHDGDRIFALVIGCFYVMGVFWSCHYLIAWIVTGKRPPMM